MANEAEQRRWNDDYWMTVWPRREELTNSVTEQLLAHLQPAPGERLLDVGCGGGQSSLAVARAVGPTGHVTGCDLSEPLLALARRRAGEGGTSNATFVAADAQTTQLEGGPFDAVISQFGVMFFDDSVAAFSNLASQVRPGGRLVFVCWQSAEQNRWNIGPLLSRYAPPPPAPPPTRRNPTGPFTLADPARTSEMLEKAGWSDVERTGYETTVLVGPETLVDEGQLAFSGVPEADRPAAWEAVQAQLAQFPTAGGRLEVPIAFQVFAAKR